MTENAGGHTVKIIKQSFLLRAKIGSGGIPAKILEKCLRIFEFNTVDFSPMALEQLQKLETVIDEAKQKKLTRDEAATKMTAIVMELKANAGMFNYPLISRLAAIMLGFLEGMKDIDDDAIEIVAAHHNTLKAIVLKKMRGQGGAMGDNLEKELKSACARYYKSRG
jgi:hypothetical protein